MKRQGEDRCGRALNVTMSQLRAAYPFKNMQLHTYWCGARKSLAELPA